MRKSILYVLVFSAFNLAYGQTQTSIPNSLWIDKPMLKQDTVLLIKGGFKKITVYKYDAVDGADGVRTNDTILVGTWTIKIDGAKILCTWDGKFSNWLEKVTSRKIKDNKIIEVIGKDDHKFELTHYLEENGIVSHTTNKIKSKYETRYHFNNISYTYLDKLLIIAEYYSSYYEPSSVPYSEYAFKYAK